MQSAPATTTQFETIKAVKADRETANIAVSYVCWDWAGEQIIVHHPSIDPLKVNAGPLGLLANRSAFAELETLYKGEKALFWELIGAPKESFNGTAPDYFDGYTVGTVYLKI